MEPGDVIADRFALEAHAGRGGMGAVFRATDRLTGETVALKVLHEEASQHLDRFVREARVLAELRHPGIVRYVAHGQTTAGCAWLAMEWLDGEDLAARLGRSGLTPGESVVLVSHVASALAAVHARGVIHRDLKPRNLFLPGGDLRRVKVLDFGVARPDDAAEALTRTGVAVGTPGYMAPEQARGGAGLTPAVDVFALGCVWFECLVGRTPFHGDNVMARLARVLLEDAPRVRDERPDVPEDISELIEWTLVKDPSQRVRDGAALAEAIGTLGLLEEGRPSRVSVAPRALTSAEQRLFSVVLVAAPSVTADTVVTAVPSPAPVDVVAVAGAHGGRVDHITGGALVVSFGSKGTATDQAARAARCALRLQALFAGHPITLATGWGRYAQRTVTGDAIDRAAALLRDDATTVRLDDVTAALLGDDFELGSDARGRVLVGAKEPRESAGRTLLGRPSPFVGRERDMRVLEAFWDECAGDGVARAVVVTAPAGAGKSRLRRELIDGIRRRGGRLRALLGRGDLVAPGAPFGLIASALRGACGVRDGEDPSSARRKVLSEIGRNLSPDAGARAAAFLGALMGVALPGGVELEAARRDARLMGDQIRSAWNAWLAAECAVQPVLLVLEDAHWGDLPSALIVDGALQCLGDRAWMVLAFARPSIRDALPGLWRERGVHELRLGDLHPRACERVVRAVLGDVAPERLERLVAQAAGNPMFLEELVRAEAEGRAVGLPSSVLAMTQSRLAAMEPEARQVLRAASVFGRVFCAAAVRALIGGGDAPSLDEWIPELVRREVLLRRADGRFHGEDEYAFRHALLREAAYGTLLDEDRALGHRLAGEWLERAGAGEREACALAEHFERGACPERAVAWYLRAAEQALEGNDLDAALALAARGVACGATGEALGGIRTIQAEAYKWRGEHERAAECSDAALRCLPHGDPRWYAAAGELVVSLGTRGERDRQAAMIPALCDPSPDGGTSCAQVVAVARLARTLLLGGRREALDEPFAWLERASACPVGGDPIAAAVIHELDAFRRSFDGDPDLCDALEAAAAGFERAGNLRVACVQRVNLGTVYTDLGFYDEAVQSLRDAVTAADRLGLRAAAAGARNNLGNALARAGDVEEALRVESDAAERYASLGDARMEGGSRTYAAMILALSGDFAAAEREARSALGLLAAAPPLRAHALAVLSRALVRQGPGRAAEALDAARAAASASPEGIDEGEAAVALALVEALLACGDVAGARDAAVGARRRLLERASRIADPRRRERFLTAVVENARTLRLALELEDARDGERGEGAVPDEGVDRAGGA